jgi:hypothetical protein
MKEFDKLATHLALRTAAMIERLQASPIQGGRLHQQAQIC